MLFAIRPHTSFLFFFNDTATTEIYTLSLHDALPISTLRCLSWHCWSRNPPPFRDRKSTRLNSSHSQISYAVFCLKKKKIKLQNVLRNLTESRKNRVLKVAEDG